MISCQTKVKVETKKPNILLIVVDDQGYADFTPFEKMIWLETFENIG
tara:strand:- start:24516 stop:24656 length:141 start_codon:yes stop_codon:yes gene_type:complete